MDKLDAKEIVSDFSEERDWIEENPVPKIRETIITTEKVTDRYGTPLVINVARKVTAKNLNLVRNRRSSLEAPQCKRYSLEKNDMDNLQQSHPPTDVNNG